MERQGDDGRRTISDGHEHQPGRRQSLHKGLYTSCRYELFGFPGCPQLQSRPLPSAPRTAYPDGLGERKRRGHRHHIAPNNHHCQGRHSQVRLSEIRSQWHKGAGEPGQWLAACQHQQPQQHGIGAAACPRKAQQQGDRHACGRQHKQCRPQEGGHSDLSLCGGWQSRAHPMEQHARLQGERKHSRCHPQTISSA